MSACDFSAFAKFNVGACLHSVAFGWVPDWVWMLLPYWPWIIIVGGLGMAYRFAGWPGVAAFAGGLGFILGRKSVAAPDPIEHVSGKDALPPLRKPHRNFGIPAKRPKGETASDRWEKS